MSVAVFLLGIDEKLPLIGIYQYNDIHGCCYDTKLPKIEGLSPEHVDREIKDTMLQ